MSAGWPEAAADPESGGADDSADEARLAPARPGVQFFICHCCRTFCCSCGCSHAAQPLPAASELPCSARCYMWEERCILAIVAINSAAVLMGLILCAQVLAVEVLWTPQDDGDYFTREDLATDYPYLNTL